jgi:hypothetical protein
MDGELAGEGACVETKGGAYVIDIDAGSGVAETGIPELEMRDLGRKRGGFR